MIVIYLGIFGMENIQRHFIMEKDFAMESKTENSEHLPLLSLLKPKLRVAY
jgi:hypothetical protein